MTEHQVFFSYARSDSAFVLKVAKALRAEGRQVWIDQLDIPKGARWDDEVEKALKACSCLLVVLSPASAQSQNVLDEVSYALEEKKAVLPILLQSGSIPFRLKRVQYIDFTGEFDEAYRQLGAALDALGTPAAQPHPELSAKAPAAGPTIEAGPAEAQRIRPAAAASASLHGAVPAPRRFPKGVVYGLLAVGVLGAGYVLFTNTRSPQHEAPPALAPVVQKPVDAPIAEPTLPSATAVTPPASTPATKPGTATPTQLVTDALVKDFVSQYLAAQKRANATELLRFYANRVDYFDQKGVDKDFILKDKQSYYRRWPDVDNRLASAIEVDRTQGEGTAQVSYTIKYWVSNPARADSRTGMARDELDLRAVNGELQIVAQRQRILNPAN